MTWPAHRPGRRWGSSCLAVSLIAAAALLPALPVAAQTPPAAAAAKPEVQDQRAPEDQLGRSTPFGAVAGFHEPVVSALRQPGQAARPAETSSATRAPGNKPGGTIAQQMTATVTIMAIDPKTPSVTIKTDKGQTMSFRVQDARRLEGYKVGDAVEITYTQALAISVEPQNK